MRIIAVIKRVFIEVFRDKRTLAMLLVAPLLILSLMYLLFNGNTVNPKIGVTGVDSHIVTALKKADFHVIHYEKVNNIKETIKDHHLDALLIYQNHNWDLIMENGDPTTGKTIQMKVSQVLSAQSQMNFMNKLSSIPLPKIDIPKTHLQTHYIYGNNKSKFFDVLSPILVGFFVFFFVFLISGIGLLKERTTGTLERLLSTPIKRWEIVTGYLVGFGVFAIIQTCIVVFFAIHILNLVLIGSIWNVILVNLLLALVALSLGTLLSTFASSEFQMVQFIPIVVIPQIFFSGIIPLDGMAYWLQILAKIMPLYYAANALKDIMYKGLNLHDISENIIILVLFAIVFIILNIVALKKYRKL